MDAMYDQDDIDRAFADLDYLISEERGSPPRSVGLCISCGGDSFTHATSISSHPGSIVCIPCGTVQSNLVIWDQMYCRTVPGKFSNYKRIHHWHERISQLVLLESQIPREHLLKIARVLLDGSTLILNKDTIRAALRPLKMQMYIEKWLQIIHRLTGMRPPVPGPCMLVHIDNMFMELQAPFDRMIDRGTRKNFLNYNYVFCRLLQMTDCNNFCMFFPLIKSKQKLKALDSLWSDICKQLNWPVTPLQTMAPFAVHLTRPAALLESLESSIVDAELVESQTVLTRIECLPSDHQYTAASKRQRLRSIQLERRSRSTAAAWKRHLREVGLRLR